MADKTVEAPAEVEQPTPEQIIEALSADITQYREAYGKLSEQDTEQKITIQVLTDRMNERDKELTDTRVYASKINMALQQSQQRIQELEQIAFGGPVPAPSPLPPTAPAKTTRKARKGGLRASTAPAPVKKDA